MTILEWKVKINGTEVSSREYRITANEVISGDPKVITNYNVRGEIDGYKSSDKDTIVLEPVDKNLNSNMFDGRIPVTTTSDGETIWLEKRELNGPTDEIKYLKEFSNSHRN